MASVFQKNGRWYLRVKNEHGHWIKEASDATTKTLAKHLAQKLAEQYERMRCGEGVVVLEKPNETVGDLLSWWLEKIRKGAPAAQWDEDMTKHLSASSLARLPVLALKAAHVEELLAAKAQEGLSPQTLNHLRGVVSRVYEKAKKLRATWGTVENPADRVERRHVPKGEDLFLSADEVPKVLAALDAHWQPLFACAIYTGLRKGELLALQKHDVDLERRQIMVSKSHARKTTKGKKALAIPINIELIPFLFVAMEASDSDLMFPAADGKRMAPGVKLHKVLRRAMGRAGIVTHYVHSCRKCDYHVTAADTARRECPEHEGKRLRTKPVVRQLKFHSLRHTFGSNAMMQGVAPFAAQRLLRHSDPSLTTETYGHHVPGFLHDEIDRLSFLPRPAPQVEAQPVTAALPAAVNAGPFVSPLSPAGAREKNEGPGSEDFSSRTEAFNWSGRQDLNLRPLAPQAESRGVQRFTGVAFHRENVGGATPSPVQPSRVFPAVHRNFVPRLSPAFKVVPNEADDYLTVADVAERVKVSRATVYAWVERDELPHVRVSHSAIRISAADLAAFMARRRR